MPQKLWREPLDAQKTKLPKAKICIATDLCKGCSFCIEFCPKKALEESDQFNKRGAHPPEVIDEGKCALCGFCTAICPEFAIFVVEKEEEDNFENEEKK